MITTEDKNASFHVGGEVYIPIGMTQTNGGYPTIQLEEKEYGLRLTLTTKFLEKEGFMHMDIKIVDSEFDPNKEHNVQLGGGGFGSNPIEVPSFISKHISTDVVAKSGNLVALGGRLHTEDVEAEEKIPFLGDIPYLGELFTRTITSNKQNDLLFFLVPEIVDANKDINDTKFYKEFKNQAEELHEIILDTNSAQEEDAVEVEELVVVDANEDVIIEDANGATIDTQVDSEVAQEIEIESEVQEEQLEIIPNTGIINEENVKPAATKGVTQELIEPVAEVQSEINTGQIFIRSKPTNGRRVQVWSKGHKFVAGEEKTINGLTWSKIIKDCSGEKCVEVTQDLWVSKKYTK